MTDRSRSVVDGIRRDLGLDRQQVDELSESYVASPKSYDLRTEFLSAKSKSTHKKLYQEYAEELTRVSAELDTASRKESLRQFHSLKCDEISNLNAVYLHELFFSNISDVDSLISADSLPFMRLTRDFGSFESWQFDFIACCMGQGNGWGVCAYSTFLQRFVNFFVSDHNVGIPVGCYPVLVIDAWEHSYFRDYLDDRKSYIYAMMKEINWKVVEDRFRKSDLIGASIK